MPKIRITPTPVGNTDLRSGEVEPQKDHPHTCGEYQNQTSKTLTGRGSPPHLWGILPSGQEVFTRGRITPTPVGNTMRNSSSKDWGRDHPHTCGEYNRGD